MQYTKKDAGLDLLRCLDQDQAHKLMDEIPGVVCGSQMSGLLLVKKILQQKSPTTTVQTTRLGFEKNR